MYTYTADSGGSRVVQGGTRFFLVLGGLIFANEKMRFYLHILIIKIIRKNKMTDKSGVHTYKWVNIEETIFYIAHGMMIVR